MSQFEFPNEIYIQEPFEQQLKEPLDGYLTWNDCEDGDIIGVYKLVGIRRVTEHKSKTLDLMDEK